jgi:hypothetical protein
MTRLAVTTLLAVLALATPALGQKPDSLPDSLRYQGAFAAEILRRHTGPHERRLLQIAESAYPRRDSVVQAVRSAHFKLPAVPDDSLLWWYSSFDRIRIPYAITQEAVQYYLMKTEAFRRGEDLEVAPSRDMERTSFSYTATVQRHDVFEMTGWTFEDVYVVELRLKWSNDCGPNCGLWINKARTVVLTADGIVLHIAGDGPGSFYVS